MAIPTERTDIHIKVLTFNNNIHTVCKWKSKICTCHKSKTVKKIRIHFFCKCLNCFRPNILYGNTMDCISFLAITFTVFLSIGGVSNIIASYSPHYFYHLRCTVLEYHYISGLKYSSTHMAPSSNAVYEYTTYDINVSKFHVKLKNRPPRL